MSPILVTFYWPFKEYFPNRIGYSCEMGEIHIHIMELFARNLERAIRRRYPLKPDGTVNQSRTANESNVSQKGISNYLSALEPKNKQHLDQIPSPSLDKISKLATALGVQPWELIHPDPELAKRQQVLYERMENEFLNRAHPIDVPTLSQSDVSSLIEEVVADGPAAAENGSLQRLLNVFASANQEQRELIISIIQAIAQVRR